MGKPFLLLVVVRHGEAVPKSSGIPDENRGLTKTGKIGLRKNLLLTKEIMASKLDLILTSPVLRAKESAEIARQVFEASNFEESIALVSESTPYEVFQSLSKYSGLQKILLVSHQPLVSQLIAGLLTWDERRFSFPPGSIAIIQLKGFTTYAECTLVALIPPRI